MYVYVTKSTVVKECFLFIQKKKKEKRRLTARFGIPDSLCELLTLTRLLVFNSTPGSILLFLLRLKICELALLKVLLKI